jgi:acyl-ACP thioesterase
MIPDKYQEEYLIPLNFVDNKSRLRPSSFFDIAQELAVRGSTQLGAPDAVLHGRGIGWILLRNAIHFDAMPGIEEKVKLQTWHSGVVGPLLTRDYLCLDASGKAIIRATSSWALMDVKARSIVKPERILDIYPSDPQCPERALLPNAPKIIFPQDCVREEAGMHRVTYSELDYNEHANNGRYPHWAIDCLPPEYPMNKTVRDFYLNYNHEIRLGESVQLLRAQGPDGAWYVEGFCGDIQCFISKIVFAD